MLQDEPFDKARHAIGALTRPVEEAFADVLQHSVEDLGRRDDVRTAGSVERSVVVTPQQAWAVLRIAGEALRNAVNDGRATCVTVRLTADPVQLTVQDDGTGFDADRVASRGFGLTSVRERSEGAAASYALTSAEGQGTTVQVSWT